MLRDEAGRLVLSATTLTDHLACVHLTAERRRMALGERGRPRAHDDPHAELVRRRGIEHETAVLERLADEAGGDVADLTIPGDTAPGAAELRAAADRTAQAMRDGTRLIYQAALWSGRWQGRPDFLRRVDAPGAPWGYAYEVLDTKLSRLVKPHVVHQLCLYTRMVGEVQGVTLDRAVVILGDGSHAPVEVGRYMALHRRAARRLEEALDHGVGDTYPEPTAHCAICRLAAECDERRRADDHLSLVAGARRDARTRLADAGVATLGALADLDDATPTPGVPGPRRDVLHHQARLQRESTLTGEPTRRHLDPLGGFGLARLTPPGAGDVYFDLEGDPYATPDGGLEYLWGWSTDAGYTALWAHTPAAERAALVAFVAFVEERRERFPGLRVVHYAPHEATTLRTLSVRYGVCEDEVDAWLREGVLLDLYAVVHQGIQVGEESYSLKALERHHGFVRHEKSVRGGGGSIVAYERWLATREPDLLRAIRDYNREDCESTASLHRWLHDRVRADAEAEFGVDFATLPAPDEKETGPPAWIPEVEALRADLHGGLPADDADDDPGQGERRLLGELLLYHRRESKPEWWTWFDLAAKTPEELVDEDAAVGLLERDDTIAPVPDKRSLLWTLRFPPQEARLKVGKDHHDPVSGTSWKVAELGDDHLVVRRTKKADPPEVAALIPGRPVDAGVLRDALVEIGRAVRDDDGRFAAVRSILRRERPRTEGVPLGPAIPELVDACLGLDGSHLAVQGPPGTGKTYAAARVIVAAIRAGRRVGVTANSHAAITNVLRAVEEHAAAEGVEFRGVYRGDEYAGPVGTIACGSNADAEDPELDLVAGTAWLFARPALEASIDLLFADEAGQLALASAVAAGRAARNIVLLGDPQQLAQVTKARHPAGAEASVLGHVIGDRPVVDPTRGVLLATSWRMHPDVCAYVSEHSYAGELRPHGDCGVQTVLSESPLAGAGLRAVEVTHQGCSQESPAEADAIATLCRALLADGRVKRRDGVTRALTPSDILVVAPYNLAVNRIQRTVPEGVRVGTVDRFQGQEAPVVFFALTCSSGDDVPRGLDFLFDPHRLNVAVSRAQCLAVLVHSPRLLDAPCRTLDQMARVSDACAFVDRATAVAV